MIITQVSLKNYTLFKSCKFDFCKGINIFVGENGTGKTHLMKVLYSATQTVDGRNSFADKLVNTMLPDDYSLAKLVNRISGEAQANIVVSAKNELDDGSKKLSITFDNKTKKKEAVITGDKGWENSFSECNSVFVPAKEILSNGFNLSAAVAKGNVKFDDTYVDIVNSAKVDRGSDNNEARKKLLKDLERVIGGKVVYDVNKDSFYIKQGNKKQEFNLMSEGIRRLSLIWQLVNNGMLEAGSVLFWDEPEANINPSYIPIIVDVILALSRNGVQIFVATHDYFLSKYIDVRKNDKDDVMYYSLRKVEDNIEYSQEKNFNLLEDNGILNTARRLYREEIGIK